MLKNNWVFVDLDDTILDTKTFKQRFFGKVTDLSGLSNEEAVKIYESCREIIDQEDWLDQFLKRLSKVSHVRKSDLEQALIQSIKESDVDQVLLKKLEQFDGLKVLFTHGNRNFQYLKINSHSLKEYFDQIIITSQNKAEYFQKIIKSEEEINCWVIDDNLKVLSAIKTDYPWVKTMTKEQFYG